MQQGRTAAPAKKQPFYRTTERVNSLFLVLLALLREASSGEGRFSPRPPGKTPVPPVSIVPHMHVFSLWWSGGGVGVQRGACTLHL